MEIFCCMCKEFREKKILGKGFPRFVESPRPDIINWENLKKVNRKQRCKVFVKRAALGILLFAVSFTLIWGVSLSEKERNEWVKSDCNGSKNLSIE